MIDMLSGATIGELFREIAQVERKIAEPKQVVLLDALTNPSDPATSHEKRSRMSHIFGVALHFRGRSPKAEAEPPDGSGDSSADSNTPARRTMDGGPQRTIQP